MKHRKKYLLLVLTIILFTSCENKAQRTIAGNWEVLSVNDLTEFEFAPNFIINLETMKVAGYSGCNRFFGSIKTDENNLIFEKMGGTRKVCPDMTSENLFLMAMQKVKSFSFENENLQLLSDTNEVIISLKAIEVEEE